MQFLLREQLINKNRTSLIASIILFIGLFVSIPNIYAEQLKQCIPAHVAEICADIDTEAGLVIITGKAAGFEGELGRANFNEGRISQTTNVAVGDLEIWADIILGEGRDFSRGHIDLHWELCLGNSAFAIRITCEDGYTRIVSWGEGGGGDGTTVTPSASINTTPGSRFAPNETWTDNPYYGSRGTFFADVTGDGKVDAIVVNDDGVTVRPANSNGSGFNPNETWTDNPYYGSRGTFFADVTGDGKADAIVVNLTGVTVRPASSNGSGFNPNETWTSNPYFGSKGTFFADVTGDDKADAIVVNDDGITVRYSE